MASKSGRAAVSVAVVLLLAAGVSTVQAQPAVPPSPPVPRRPALPPMPAVPAAPRVPRVAVAAQPPQHAEDMDDVSMEDGEAGDPAESPAERIDELYEEGTDALDEEQWDDAIRAFDEVVRHGGARVDGALYWKAYALRKVGRGAEALSAIGTLRRTAPKSKWLNEARVLEMEIRQDSGVKPAPEAAADEELKLIALNSLMSADSNRALPMLEAFLSSNSSRKLRDKALFVLTQSDSPQARAIVADIARGRRHTDLQRNAIKYMGLFGGQESRSELSGIYASAGSDVDVKKAVLQAYMVSGDKQNMLLVARGEKSPELRRAAIQQLGAMGAQSELWELYGSESDFQVKKSILQGMFVGGGDERLIELARTESSPELRRVVVRNLGLLSNTRTSATLIALYQNDPDPLVRREALQGLFIQGNAAALVRLARSEKDPARRKELVEKLSVMDSKEAIDYLMELLK